MKKVTWIPFNACNVHCLHATKGKGRLVQETPSRVFMRRHKANMFVSLSAVFFFPVWRSNELLCPNPGFAAPAEAGGLQRCPVWNAIVFMGSPYVAHFVASRRFFVKDCFWGLCGAVCAPFIHTGLNRKLCSILPDETLLGGRGILRIWGQILSSGNHHSFFLTLICGGSSVWYIFTEAHTPCSGPCLLKCSNSNTTWSKGKRVRGTTVPMDTC